MPIYEFECELKHRYEKIFPISKCPNRILCDECTLLYSNEDEDILVWAEKQWSIPAKMELGKPTVVFVNPSTGEAQVAAGTHDSPPPGFVKQELKSSIERSRFEQVQNKINSEKDMIYNESNRLQTETARKALHDDINANLNAKQTDFDEHGNKIEFFYDEPTKILMKQAMNRKRKPLKKRKTQFAFDVNHKDKSNLK